MFDFPQHSHLKHDSSNFMEKARRNSYSLLYVTDDWCTFLKCNVHRANLGDKEFGSTAVLAFPD